MIFLFLPIPLLTLLPHIHTRQKTKKKQEKKELTREIKAKQEELYKRHQEELRLFDASVSSPSSSTTSSLFPLPEKSIES
jgi:hypothetical protein